MWQCRYPNGFAGLEVALFAVTCFIGQTPPCSTSGESTSPYRVITRRGLSAATSLSRQVADLSWSTGQPLSLPSLAVNARPLFDCHYDNNVCISLTNIVGSVQDSIGVTLDFPIHLRTNHTVRVCEILINYLA